MAARRLEEAAATLLEVAVRVLFLVVEDLRVVALIDRARAGEASRRDQSPHHRAPIGCHVAPGRAGADGRIMVVSLCRMSHT